jgi:uncharacterized membrane-anchored protein YhcB (DUF1043 family)
MLASIRKIFQSDTFIPTSAVFPSIDNLQLARELRLEEQGQKRGAANQPPADAKVLDPVEIEAISAIEERRRKGLENFEQNRSVYAARLTRTAGIAQEIKTSAGRARNDFGTATQKWRNSIVSARERLNETYSYRKTFREQHGLVRPAKQFNGWANVVLLAAILIVVEAGMNSYLFAKGNEFGLLGGGIAALLFSLVNVTACLMLGYFAHNSNHRNPGWKLFGIFLILFWIVFAATINLGIAHFRDGLEAGVAWTEAASGAIRKLLNSPLDLGTIESWLLMAIGLIISVVSFLKGWFTDDPYPEYGALERSLEDARLEYEGRLQDALAELQQVRDQAIEEFTETNELVKEAVSEAIDALYGHTTLSQHLGTFLDQCDLAAAQLLAIYRDANWSARTEPAPQTFNEGHTFRTFVPAPVQEGLKDTAQAEAMKVDQIITEETQRLFDLFDEARREFMDLDIAQSGSGRPAPGAEQPVLRAVRSERLAAER